MLVSGWKLWGRPLFFTMFPDKRWIFLWPGYNPDWREWQQYVTSVTRVRSTIHWPHSCKGRHCTFIHLKFYSAKYNVRNQLDRSDVYVNSYLYCRIRPEGRYIKSSQVADAERDPIAIAKFLVLRVMQGKRRDVVFGSPCIIHCYYVTWRSNATIQCFTVLVRYDTIRYECVFNVQ